MLFLNWIATIASGRKLKSIGDVIFVNLICIFLAWSRHFLDLARNISGVAIVVTSYPVLNSSHLAKNLEREKKLEREALNFASRLRIFLAWNLHFLKLAQNIAGVEAAVAFYPVLLDFYACCSNSQQTVVALKDHDCCFSWLISQCSLDEELATEVAWVVVYLSALSNVAFSMLVKSDLLQLLVERLATSNSLQLLIPVLRSLGNLVAGDAHTTNVLEAAWVLSNIAAGSIEHKQLIYSSEAVPLLLRLLSTEPFDIRKEVAYVLGNLCVAPSEGSGRPSLILDHLVSLVSKGCLPGFVDLVRSADTEAAKLGLQFMELITSMKHRHFKTSAVLRGMPNSEGPKLVEREDGIDAMERFQFHENEELRNMANELVDTYFGEDYGLDE
ncbi:hypothetical protein TEA_002178 [Camellia sinensis var. sinensis]|uniref:IBB domain-containing protein n=1 Tax=Camellia sinensis var. sinensis TaxID=542762 RepID=A0A4S4F4P3_CAMSN|nr:hypothetical protein TEA_002178 [Camellia sinensis var. sinensis]